MNTIEKIITEIEKIAEECYFYKNKINLSVKDNELFIDEMTLEGTTDRGRNVVVEYYDILFDEMLDDLKTRVDDYDVSYETYLWLDDTGHGITRATYDMLDCYKDSEETLEMLENLENLLHNLDTEL